MATYAAITTTIENATHPLMHLSIHKLSLITQKIDKTSGYGSDDKIGRAFQTTVFEEGIDVGKAKKCD